MSVFADLRTEDVVQDETDVIGGRGPLESGLYPFEVTLAYAGKADSGARSLTLHLTTDNGSEVRETLWVTSGTAKGGKHFYTTQSGENKFLPGFNIGNSLALLTVGKELFDLDGEDRLVNLYSFDAGKEVPTKVTVIPELMGQRAIAGLLRQTVDKNIKADNGAYVPSGETRDENVIDKIFRESDRMTTAEIRAGAESAVFIDTWEAKNKGVTRDRTNKDAAKGNTGKAGGFGNKAKGPSKSLFAPAA